MSSLGFPNNVIRAMSVGSRRRNRTVSDVLHDGGA